MAEFDNILQVLAISTSLEQVAIHCFFALEFLYKKFNNQNAKFKLIEYLDKAIHEKKHTELTLFQQKTLLTRYKSLGEIYIDNKEHESAITISNSGINILKNTPLNREYPNLIYELYNNKAIAHFRLKELNQALNLFEQIEANYLKNNHQKISSIHLNMGMVYKEMGKKEEAIKYYQKALKNCNNHSTFLSLFLNLGDSWLELGMVDFAERYYNKYFENLQDKYDYLSWGKGHHNLGMVATARGNFKEARKQYHLAIELYLSSSKYHLARLFSDLGILETLAANYEDSIAYFHKSLINFDDSQDKTLICQIYLNLFAPYFYLKNYDKAVESCETSLKICKGHYYFEAINYSRLTIVYSIKNKDSIAQKYCQLALSQVHTLHQSQIDFLIQNIEDFSKFLTQKSHILVLKQYFVHARNSKN